MDQEFYTGKISQLSDEKLKELLRLRNSKNGEIMRLAENEAIKRGIDPLTIESRQSEVVSKGRKSKKDEGLGWRDILVHILSG